MTLNATPLWMQGLSTHTANMYRRMLDDLSGMKPGIFQSGDFQVTQNGSPNMTVNVSTGTALVRGTEDASFQGMYWVENEATQNVSITAAHATLNRIDLVVIRIRDNAYSTGPSNDATIYVVDGTPASSPSAPSAPPNSLILAQVAVDAAVTQILTADITNVRTTTTGQGYAGLKGAFRRATSSNRPSTNLQAYQDFIVEDDTKRPYYHNGTNWIPFGAYGVTNTLSSFTLDVSAADSTCTLTVPIGTWLLISKCEYEYTGSSGGVGQTMWIRNVTAGTDIDKSEVYSAALGPWRMVGHCSAIVTVAASTQFAVRGVSSTASNSSLTEIKLHAIAVAG